VPSVSAPAPKTTGHLAMMSALDISTPLSFRKEAKHERKE
jgi:hypothetical protein